MKKYWLLAVILLITTGAFAQDVQTQPKNDKDVEKDTRLEKKISLSFNNAKLMDVLDGMKKSTEIDFTAGNNDRDWRIRERKVTVYADNIPAESVKNAISKLLGYRVSRYGKKNEWGYLFWQDLKSKQLESELLASAKVLASERAIQLRESAMDSAATALSMSSEEAMKLKETDPWTAYLGGTKTGRGFANLMSALNEIAPIERDLMLRGKRIDISLEGLSPELNSAVQDSISGGLGGMIRQSAMGQLDSVKPSNITFMSMSEIGGGDMAGVAGFGGMAIISGKIPGMPDLSGLNPFGDGIPLGIFPVTKGNSMVGNAFADLYFSLDEGKNLQEAIGDLQANATNPDFLAETMARESAIEKNPPVDPSMLREVEIADMRDDIALSQVDQTRSTEMQGKMMKEISRALDMPVILESFNSSMPIAPFIKAGKQPLYKVLAGIEKAGYLWQISNGILLLQPEDWALQRSYEIPESFIVKYRSILAKQGEFTLEDIADIAYQLTDDQIQNNLVADPELTYALVSLISPVGGNRNLLRVYGSMNNQQKVAIKSESGLPFAKLSNVQWDRLNTVLSEKIGGLYINDGSIRLLANSVNTNQNPSNGQMGNLQMPVFETTVLIENEEKPRVQQFMIILYGKDQIALMKGMQKSAEDAIKKSKETDKPTK